MENLQTKSPAFSRKLFGQTDKAIEFINDNRDKFVFNTGESLLSFDKIIVQHTQFGIDVFCMVNSSKKYSMSWSLKEIQIKI